MHMQWMNSYRIPFSTLVSYIPVFATIVTTFFSIILARATLRYVEATPDAVRQRFIDIGLGAEFTDAYTSMLAAAVDKPALVTREIEKITGQPATPFARWVSDHRHLFTK